MNTETKTAKDLLKRIEEKREKLHHLAREEGFTPSVIEVSKELDQLLNLYNGMTTKGHLSM